MSALQRLCGHINDLLEAARKVQAFLEHGNLPKKRAENPQRWILAAELHDALGLTYREVGEALGAHMNSDYYAIKGTNKKAADMVKKGRELLLQVLKDEAFYRTHLAAVKPALERWHSRLKEALDALQAGNTERFIPLVFERLDSQEHLLSDIWNAEDKEEDEQDLLESLSERR